MPEDDFVDGESRSIEAWLREGQELARSLDTSRREYVDSFDVLGLDPLAQGAATALIDQIRATWSDWAASAPLMVKMAFSDAEAEESR
jgi:capsid protein